jgi:hypothetical protein
MSMTLEVEVWYYVIRHRAGLQQVHDFTTTA